ncbi:MAG: hypothetical protein ACD_12C00889G0004 [uncultured bacterium]|nr:MAG: hypothetical protein ACD_12C00889G0004 [uncultured bacterium]
MKNELIKQLLENLKNQKKFDEKFIDILFKSNENRETGETTANNILELIKIRYDQTKKNKA